MSRTDQQAQLPPLASTIRKTPLAAVPQYTSPSGVNATALISLSSNPSENSDAVGTGVCREKEAVACPGEGPGSGTGLQTLNGSWWKMCRATPSSPRHPSTGICRKASPPGGSRSGRSAILSGHEDRSIPCWEAADDTPSYPWYRYTPVAESFAAQRLPALSATIATKRFPLVIG